MNILIIDQCSKNKSTETATNLDFDTIRRQSRERLVEDEDIPTVPAGRLYTGRQQQHINDAVELLRAHGHDVDRYFLNAGFGLVNETTPLPPYDTTFADMDDTAIRQRTQELGLTDEVQTLITSQNPYDIIFLPLGWDYYYSLDLDAILAATPDSSTVVLFNQEDRDDPANGVVSIPARTDEARQQGVIVVALKGVYLHHFAEHISNGAVVNEPTDIRDHCMIKYTAQKDPDQPPFSS